MKLHDLNKKTGHLILFIIKENRAANFSIFFPIAGLEQFDALLKISEGFETCFGRFAERDEYSVMGYSINDIGRVRDIFPEVDEKRMVRFEVAQFLDEDSDFVDSLARIILKRLIENERPLFPDIRTGSMATGANFFDREEKITEIWDKVQAKNLLLQSPRRYGKSSLLDYISNHPKSGWLICSTDLQGGKSSEDFLELIVDRLMQSKDCNSCLPEPLASTEVWKESEIVKLDRIREERSRIKKNWKNYGRTLFESMNSTDKRMLVILDECSFLLEDMIAAKDREQVIDLLRWFYEERKRASNISFILSGSEHLPAFLNSQEIDTSLLDDLESVHLGLFDPSTAQEFIFLALAGQGVAVCLSEINKMLCLMGEPIPYFLQLFLDNLSVACRNEEEITAGKIENIYYEKLLGSESKRHFESIEQQLERYKRYGQFSRSGAETILNLLSRKDYVDIRELEAAWIGATDNKDKFDAILDMLKDDFYIDKNGEKVCFLSKLVRDWWLRYGSLSENKY